MVSKKSSDKRPYIIALSFFVILFILMKVQDVRTESVADNPFDVIQKQTGPLTAPESKRLPSSEVYQNQNAGIAASVSASSVLAAGVDALDQIAIEKRRKLAKSTLATLFTAQLAFKIENQRFTSDLLLMGLEIPALLDFKFGFSESFTAASLVNGEQPGAMNTDALIGEPLDADGVLRLHYTEATGEIDFKSFLHLCRKKCEVHEDSFEAIAIVPISGTQSYDVFLVNDRKEIIHAYDGIRGKSLFN